jgi:hypothetical protein
MVCGQELEAQLLQLLQMSYVTYGKKFVMGGVFVVLHLEIPSYCNCDTADKN